MTTYTPRHVGRESYPEQGTEHATYVARHRACCAPCRKGI